MRLLVPALFLFWAQCVAQAAQPELVVLSGAGEIREGLPELTRHPDGDSIVQALSTGFPRTVVRLYRLVQNFRAHQEGIEIEPAYLYLSTNQGGFPRYGFILDGERKPMTAYVDLHQSSPITGQFGAVDQIFPHELGHVLIRQLIGELGDGGANQVHATALRTDRIVAFNEGFAEHFQIMTLDSDEAPPETARLAVDQRAHTDAARNLQRYRQALEATWSPGAPARMRFLFWFSRTEDVLRYHWVKSNAFAREPKIDPGMLSEADPYRAYLIQAVFPGESNAPLKPASILVSTEGVVSSLFLRWVQDATVRALRPSPDFFSQFDVASQEVSPLENAYLKLFFAFASQRPQDVIGVIEGYQRTFPAEAEAIARIVDEVFLGQPIPKAPEIWLANPDFKTGTTLFDQYRGLPRMHTFDLNAASRVDLIGIPGVTPAVAERIEQAAPFGSLEELSWVEGVTDELLQSFRRMEEAMSTLRASHDEEESDLSIADILKPYLWRALSLLGACGILGALLYRLVRSVSWWRAALNGLTASFLLLASAWLMEGWEVWPSFLIPLLALGLPAALWQLARKRRLGPALHTLAAWVATLLPAAASVQTWI